MVPWLQELLTTKPKSNVQKPNRLLPGMWLPYPLYAICSAE